MNVHTACSACSDANVFIPPLRRRLQHTTHRFYGLWCAGIYAQINDYQFVSEMVTYILSTEVKCMNLGLRGFFLPFMPKTDVGRYFCLPPYINNKVMDTPPLTQTFQDFLGFVLFFPFFWNFSNWYNA